MAFDEELDSRVAEVVGPWGTTRKKMFGGTGYMLSGNLLAGVHKDHLVLRLGDEQGGNLLATDRRARAFDITGHAMAGWVMIGPVEIDDDQLVLWLSAAKGYVETLPPK
jgi:hypothetical protein